LANLVYVSVILGLALPLGHRGPAWVAIAWLAGNAVAGLFAFVVGAGGARAHADRVLRTRALALDAAHAVDDVEVRADRSVP
jgi:hypothetical protein